MFPFVSRLKQVASTHGIAAATPPMLAALSHKGVLSYTGALFLIKTSLVGEVLDVALLALGRKSLFQGIKSRRAIAATLMQVFVAREYQRLPRTWHSGEYRRTRISFHSKTSLALRNPQVVTDRQSAKAAWFIVDGCTITLPGVRTMP